MTTPDEQERYHRNLGLEQHADVVDLISQARKEIASDHVTRPELAAELKALNNSLTLKIVAVLALVKLDLPSEISVPAVSALALKCVYSVVTARFSS